MRGFFYFFFIQLIISRQITSPSTEGTGSRPPNPKNRLVEIILVFTPLQNPAGMDGAMSIQTKPTKILRMGPPNERTR